MDLVTPLVAGAAGALVAKLADRGVEWLIQLVGSHSLAVQEQAKKNTESFLIHLGRRVEILEAELQGDQKKVFDEALDHPGLSLSMQKALICAAATENDDRHIILAELIAQRLTAGADDLIALVGAASCDVVNALSSKHIRILGVLARLFMIRPPNRPKIIDQGTYDDYVTWWWKPLGQIWQEIQGISSIDVDHLEALSCIRYIPFGSKNLIKVLTLPVEPEQLRLPIAKFEAFEWWPDFLKEWDKCIKNIDLTSVGSLIGVLYHDSRIETKTDIKW